MPSIKLYIKLKALEEKRDAGNLSQEEFRSQRDSILSKLQRIKNSSIKGVK